MSQRDESAADLGAIGDLIERLAKVARTQGMASVKVEIEGLKVSIKSGTVTVTPTAVGQPPESGFAIPVDFAQPAGDGSIPTTVALTAPMVGTFYTAPSPGDPPFVSVGDRIVAGQTIGIIEAMKIMNEIPAERGGTVVEVLVRSGQAVEYGSPLFTIDPMA